MSSITPKVTVSEGDFLRFDDGGTVQVRAVSDMGILIQGDFPLPSFIEENEEAYGVRDPEEDHYWIAQVPPCDFEEAFLNASSFNRAPKYWDRTTN